MTLIIGLNVSDKIYLACDTRVTQYDDQDKKRQTFKDNVIKLAPLYGKNILDFPCESKNLISVAVAGNVKLATHFFRVIRKDIYSGQLSNDIRELYEQIDQNYLNKMVDSWLSTGGEYKKNCCLIIGGNAHQRNKKIPVGSLKKLVELYSKEQSDYKNKRAEIQKLVETDPTFKALNAKLINEAGKSAIELLDESTVPKIPAYIKQAIENGLTEIPDLPDSLLFCVQVKVTPEGVNFDKKKAEWGQFIARGTNDITEGDLPESLLAALELMPGKEKNQEHLVEASIISTTISDIAKERDVQGIGGTVVINAVKKDVSQIMTKNTHNNGLLHIELDGQQVPAIPFFQYTNSLKGTMEAEL